jgi:hypothetical protein
MRPAARPALIAIALAFAALIAGCGAAASSGPGPAAGALSAGAPLATSLGTADGTWATTVMGGSAATHNNFWQLFVRPAGSTEWKLVTPPGVASNGGLVTADAGGQSLITGIRPSLDLTYTPLTTTHNGGQAWAPAGPLDAALADAPDALAAAPGTGHLLALLTNGTVKAAAPGYTRWTTLASQRSLAATPAGRRCGLTALTAGAFTPSGTPLLAGRCSRPGIAGIFAARNGTWQAAGPALPATLAHQHTTVLRLTRTSNGDAALLETGTGPETSLLAAWSTGDGGRWALSPEVRLHGARLASASFGPGGAAALVLTGNRAETITGAGAAWRSLPTLPAGTATLASGPSGGFDALAVHRTRLTVWQLGPGTAAWRATQAMNVPVQFGSSG